MIENHRRYWVSIPHQREFMPVNHSTPIRLNDMVFTLPYMSFSFQCLNLVSARNLDLVISLHSIENTETTVLRNMRIPFLKRTTNRTPPTTQGGLHLQGQVTNNHSAINGNWEAKMNILIIPKAKDYLRMGFHSCLTCLQ